MRTTRGVFGGLAVGVMLAGVGLAGCNGETEQDDMKTTDVAAADKYESVSEEEQIAGNLAKLSEADRALAATQKVCPVANKRLGWMGVPTKTTVAGHEVLLCCDGCEEPLKKEPGKYLAVIGLTPKAEPPAGAEQDGDAAPAPADQPGS